MKSTCPSPPQVPWLQGLARRIGTHWVVKMLGTTAGISGFFILYFWVMRSTGGQAVVVPATAIDQWFDVHQLALVPYVSLWFYVSLAPALSANLAALRNYVLGSAVMAGVGLATFWFYPTTTPVMDVNWSHYPALEFLKRADSGGNAFPSLHVAFAAFSAVVIARDLRELGAPAAARAANWLWCAAIVYSTLATRQHVVIDVAGGLLLAWLAVLVCRTHAPQPVLQR
jgi:membrane-associated phospholipid phosphatase